MITGKGTKLFKSREDAGKQLAIMLAEEYIRENPIILGVPRGGVEIAYYVADRMHTEFSVVVAKKLGYPEFEELAFGAVAEDGTVYMSPLAKTKLHTEIIERVIEEKKIEIDRRIAKYREGKPLPDMNGRTVIIVDDGIATGATIIPLIRMCKNKGASKVVVAAPVAPKETNPSLLSEADAFRALAQPELFQAVGQFYERFGDVSDEEVAEFLNR